MWWEFSGRSRAIGLRRGQFGFGTGQVRIRHVRPIQIRLVQIRPNQNRIGQIGMGQIRLLQICIRQIGPAEVRPAQIHIPKIGGDQVQIAKIPLACGIPTQKLFRIHIFPGRVMWRDPTRNNARPR
jgi:hypothetical protein